MSPRSKFRSRLGVLLLPLLIAVGAAPAQQGRWLVGLDGVWSTIGENDDAVEIIVDETAPGAGFQAGYLITPGFMLRLYGAAADHATNDAGIDLRFGGGTIDAVFLFRAGHGTRPYLFGGLGGYSLESRRGRFTYKTEGPGAAFGGGVQAMLGARVSLHGSWRIERVYWKEASATYIAPGGGTTTITVPIDESGWANKFTLGLGVWL